MATPFTGAWGDIQLALTNVVVQSRPGPGQGLGQRAQTSTHAWPTAQKASAVGAGPGRSSRCQLSDIAIEAPAPGDQPRAGATRRRQPARAGGRRRAASPNGSARCGC